MKDLLSFINGTIVGVITGFLIDRFFSGDNQQIVFTLVLMAPLYFFVRKAYMTEDFLKRAIITAIGFLVGYFYGALHW